MICKAQSSGIGMHMYVCKHTHGGAIMRIGSHDLMWLLQLIYIKNMIDKDVFVKASNHKTIH